MKLTNYSEKHQEMINLRKKAENMFNTLDGTNKDNFTFIDSACLMIQTADKLIMGYYLKARKESVEYHEILKKEENEGEGEKEVFYNKLLIKLKRMVHNA